MHLMSDKQLGICHGGSIYTMKLVNATNQNLFFFCSLGQLVVKHLLAHLCPKVFL